MVAGVGDIDGDGRPDIAISAVTAIVDALNWDGGNPAQLQPVQRQSGETFVIFGAAIDAALAGGAPIDLANLQPSQGVYIPGRWEDATETHMALAGAGDVNNDGFDDLLISRAFDDSRVTPDGVLTSGQSEGFQAGETYLISGAAIAAQKSGTGTLPLWSVPNASDAQPALDGIIIFDGIDDGDVSGWAIAGAGDVNDDGFADIIIGARDAANLDDIDQAGETYVIFGNGDAIDGQIVSLDSVDAATAPRDGIVLHGSDSGDRSGYAVSSAGDVDGDGTDDVLIGTNYGEPDDGTRNSSGEVYLIFGDALAAERLADRTLEVDALTNTQGVTIIGRTIGAALGEEVAAFGDIDGDGNGDIALAGNFADSQGRSDNGEVTVIFSSVLAAEREPGGDGILDLATLTPAQGVRILGASPNDRLGDRILGERTVDNAGDVDGDGLDDLLIGSRLAENADNETGAGQTFLVFGSAIAAEQTADGIIDLAALTKEQGIVIDGADANDRSGISVAGIGDVNADGFDDILIGADLADGEAASAAGEAYLISGAALAFEKTTDGRVDLANLGDLQQDTTPPDVSVDPLATTDTTPMLTGLVDDPAATVTVTVGGQTVAATNNGDGTWTLADDILAPLAPGAYDVSVTAVDPIGNDTVETAVNALTIDQPTVLIEITPGSGLTASTFSASSFQVTNLNFFAQIESVSLDLSTAILPDMVFDPSGTGGDTTAKVLTPDSGAAQTGLVVPGNPATDPFSQPRNGGFDVVTAAFTDFDQREEFTFSVDVDPNSLQGLGFGGSAGAVSGFELIGATVTVGLSDGTVLVGTLYEDGSAGGAQVVLTETLPLAPLIAFDGSASSPVEVGASDLAQAVLITGTPDAYFSLLQVDGRLLIAGGADPFDVPDADLPFYANEALASVIFNGQFDADGEARVDVTLLQTAGAGSDPDGGINTFVAVESVVPYGVDQATSPISNVLIATVNAAPQVSVDPLLTNDTTPALSGTVDDPSASITVTVDGQSLGAVNNGDGTWTLADDLLTALDDGDYDVVVRAVDDFGNTGTDTTTDELTVDTEAPMVGVDGLVTNDRTPALTGTVDDPDATLSVSVAGQTVAAVNNGDGTWTLPDNTLTTLADGVYDVVATARDAAGNEATDGTAGELEIGNAPETYTVTVAADQLDAFGPGLTVDDMGGADDLSLREAIELANQRPGIADRITFDAAVFNGEDQDTIRLELGTLSLTASLTIDGDLNDDGAPDVTVSGDASGNDEATADLDGNAITDALANALAGTDLDNVRVIAITSGTAVLDGLVITGGATTGTDGGAGVYVAAGAGVEMLNASLSGNAVLGQFAGGGGLLNRGTASIDDTLIFANSAYGQNAGGGGVFNARAADLEIAGSRITGNTVISAASDGGGLANFGTALLSDTAVSDNTAGYGAGISSYGALTVRDGIIDGNIAARQGGGVFIGSSGDALITDTHIDGNDGGTTGGGVLNRGTLTLANSTLSANDGGFFSGDGLSNGGSAYLLNATIADNVNDGNASAIATFGASSGVSSDLVLTNTTVTGNEGRGLSVFIGADATVANSIVLGNGAGVFGEVFGGYSALGLNIIGEGTDTDAGDGVINAAAVNVFADPVSNGSTTAGRLADSGGPVPTVALNPVSFNPALDTGTAPLPTEQDLGADIDGDGSIATATIALDALGQARDVDLPGVGGTPDLGAVEVQALPGGEETPSLTVTTALDRVDAFDGLTSLREAIALAERTPGSQTITFDSGVFDGEAGDVIHLTLGSLGLRSDVTIDGDLDDDDTPDVVLSGDAARNDATVLSAGGQVITDAAANTEGSDNTRVLDVVGATVDLDGLVITGGVSGSAYFGGGGIRIDAASDVGVRNTLIAGNLASAGSDGGGLWNGGMLDLSGVTLSGNRAENGSGGGLYSDGVLTIQGGSIEGNQALGLYGDGGGLATRGSLFVDGTRIANNLAEDDGGGLRASSGTASLEGVVLSGNQAVQGGGIDNTAALAVSGSLITGNETTGGFGKGGGLRNGGAATLLNTAVTDNKSGSSGGGIQNDDTATLVNVTLLGNTADSSGGGLNSDFFSDSSLVNVTTVQNTAGQDGGGIRNGGTLSLTSSTLTGNSAGDEGGGLNNDNEATLTDTILLGNDAPTGSDLAGASFGGETTLYAGLNIVGDGGDTDPGDGVINAAPADVFAETSPNGTVLAGVIGDNGGAVETVALNPFPVNPALDAAAGLLPSETALGLDVDGDGSTDTAAVSVDARLEDRSVDLPDLPGGRDLGAFELQIDEVPQAEVFTVTTANDELDATGSGLTLADMGGADDLSLREAIALADQVPEIADTITFDASLFDGEPADVIRLTLGTLTLSTDVTINGDLNGDGVADVTISGDAGGNDALTADPDGRVISDIDQTLSDGTDTDNVGVFVVTGAAVGLEGLIITGGVTGQGGGIYADTDSTLTVTRSSVSGNRAVSDGGGIFSAGRVTISDSTVAGNGAASGGGLYTAGEADLTETVIANNDAAFGGGVNARGVLTISGGAIRSNDASDTGGGLYTTGQADIDGTMIALNTAGTGGGIANRDGGSLVLTNATVSANEAAFSGGGISNRAMLDITDSAIVDNTTGEFGSGAGLKNLNTGTVILSGSSVTGNIASSLGGGIYSAGDLTADNLVITQNSGSGGGGIVNRSGGTARITDSVLSENTATANNGGGGILSTGDLILTNSTVENNTATSSGARGGGVNVSNGATSTAIIGSTISGNEAPGAQARGGGVAVSINSIFTLVDSVVSGNSVGGRGGGLDLYSETQILNTTISDNQSGQSGGGVLVVSGGTFADAPVVSLTNATISGNRSGFDGAGLSAFGESQVTLVQSTVSGNVNTDNFGYAGGIHGGRNAQVGLANSIVLGNSAAYMPELSGSVSFSGLNIVGEGSDADPDDNVINAAATDVFETTVAAGDTIAGGLANNGGPTPTIALKADPGNPAVNTGTLAVLPADSLDADDDGNLLETVPVDQRGLSRIAEGSPDLGAFETAAGPVLSQDDVFIGDGGAFAGEGGQDLYIDGPGDGTFDGGDGIDTAAFSGVSSGFAVTQGSVLVTDTDPLDAFGDLGTNRLTDVEILLFTGPDGRIGGGDDERFILVGSEGFASVADAAAALTIGPGDTILGFGLSTQALADQIADAGLTDIVEARTIGAAPAVPELIRVNDWFSETTGSGGFNATFRLHLSDDLIIGDTVSDWTLTVGIDDEAARFSTGWLTGYNASVDFDPSAGTFSTLGKSYQLDLESSDTITFSVQVQGTGFDENDFSFTFSDLDPAPDDPPPPGGDGLVLDASDVNDWGRGARQDITLTNVSDETVSGWSVLIDLDPGDLANLAFTKVYRAELTILNGEDLVFTPLFYTEEIAPGDTEFFGLNVDVLDDTGLPWTADDISLL